MFKLARFLKPYKKQVIAGPIFKLIEAVFELIVPLVMANIIDIGVKNNDGPYIWRMGGLLRLLGVVGLVGGAYCYPHQNLVGSLLLLYGVILLLVAISWKNFQLRSSQRQLPRGMRECTYEFDEEEIICNTEAGITRYSYEQAFAVVSDQNWYVIFFDMSHGIILDKAGFTTGDAMSFKAFIGQHTQLPIQEF